MQPALPPCARSGFTFLEAIIALAIAALLVAVSARSLTTVFRADRSADRLLESGLLLRRVSTGQYLGSALENTPEAWPAGWRVETEPVQTGAGAEARHWETARCVSDELSVEIAFRQRE